MKNNFNYYSFYNLLRNFMIFINSKVIQLVRKYILFKKLLNKLKFLLIKLIKYILNYIFYIIIILLTLIFYFLLKN